MKILIIGGTGLISTPITRLLLERGDDVVLVNRGRSETRFDGSIRRLVSDRNDFAAFEAQMAQAGPFDCVIDMVCFTPAQAESAVRAFQGRTGQFIFCSTVDVYSKPAARFPYREDEPRNALTDYGRNKAKCEDIFMAAQQRGDFAATILRPAMTYGEGAALVNTFGWNTTVLHRLRQGKPIVVHGNGQALWVVCHVDDCARAFVNAIGNARTFGKAYHVTGEEWLTWDNFYRGIARAMNAPEPTLIHIPADLLARLAPRDVGITTFNFQYSNVYDNTAAKADLGFQYTIPWVEGARRTIAWMDSKGLINGSDDPFFDQLIAAWERLCAEMTARAARKETP
jgi:nucleoside-diphosphate-sugar epimerase